MADAIFDAVIIGGGNKGLILAMYLTKYAGMRVGIFEQRHEAGGGWSTDEGAAPGFLADYHASEVGPLYHVTTRQDFPEWDELGGAITYPTVSNSAIFEEDESCIAIYTHEADPNQERSATSIAQFSQRDAETWIRLQETFNKHILPYYLEYVYSPAVPVGTPDAMDKLIADPKAGIDPSWLYKTPLEVFRDVFESDAFIAMHLRITYSALAASPDTSGMGLHVFLLSMGAPYYGGVIGGTHSWAHVACKIIFANGGKIFTNSGVDKVIIENGRAKGIQLVDGSQVEAKKLVVSTLDPYTLCFKLVGKEYFDWRTLRRVENLERRIGTIAWYTWALHEAPKYKAESINPDIHETTTTALIPKDPEALAREHAMRKVGKMPEKLLLNVDDHSCIDKTRAPEGKCAMITEQFVLPADALSEREWLEFKKKHAEDVMKVWQKHTLNMSWDNVIGYIPLTPYDHCRLANMAPTGTWGVIDTGIPSQYGRYRPVPELAGHKTPVENLYATGAAWHPFSGAHSFQGYNCYKVIAKDFGLRKPWEELGRPY